MERQIYNTGSLLTTLEYFERTYGMSSQDFYAQLLADELPANIPGFTRHLWASFYREAREDDDGAFAAHVESTLQLA